VFVVLVFLNLSNIISVMGCEGFLCGSESLPRWVSWGAGVLIIGWMIIAFMHLMSPDEPADDWRRPGIGGH
jgi:hypothetical protein